MSLTLSLPAQQKISADLDFADAIRASLNTFCQEVLGYADLTPIHTELCRFLQKDIRTKLILMPRYSFKSSIATVAYALWQLYRNPSLRILVYSDSVTRSQAFLTEMKNHMLGMKPNSKFRERCGEWEVDPKQGLWNQSAVVIGAREMAHAEPSIDTAGLESSKVGAHYDLIIFDDLVTRENVTTAELMQKTYECYKAARSLLKPGGDIVIVGTRWNFGDMYGRLLTELDGDPTFGTFIEKAEVCGEYPFASIGLDQAFLSQQRREQGSYMYSCLYQNEPVDNDTATFKASDFTFYAPGAYPSGLYITACLDPIPPHEKTEGDDAAITIVGTDHELNLYLLDIVAGRLQPSDQIEELFRLHAKWTIQNLGLETNAFQKVMKRDLEFRYRQEQRRNPRFRFFQITEFVGSSLPNKELRIRGLQPYHERHALRFPGKSLDTLTGMYQKLSMQMLQFPKGSKDDIVDSLAGHIQLHRAGTKHTVPTDIPYTSAAWYEREVYLKQRVKEIRRTPRWQRPPVPQLAFS